jgi:hypothetical protein
MSERLSQRDFLQEIEDTAPPPNLRQEAIHELVLPYFDPVDLRLAIADGRDIREVLRYEHPLPPAIEQMMDTLRLILTPKPYEQIKSPRDIAALMLLQMGHLDQEEFRVAMLDTRNHVRGIHTVYRGTVNSAQIRVGEVFKEAIKINAVGIIACHCHPNYSATGGSGEFTRCKSPRSSYFR